MLASKQRQIERWSQLKQPVVSHLKCYVCDFVGTIDQYQVLKSNDIFEAGELVRYKCPTCGLIFGDLRFLNLSRDEIDRDYADLYSYYNEGNTTQYIITTLNSLELFSDKTKSYLDYACGKWNNHIDLLRGNGYNITGYDKYVIKGNILTDISQTKYDVVFSCNYIEHVIDPYEDVRDMISHTNLNGYLIFITQCFEYCYEFSHYHTFFFVDQSFQILCEKLGLTLIHSAKIMFHDGSFTIVKVAKMPTKNDCS